MLDWLVKWGVRKWLVDVVNTALERHGDGVARARSFVQKVVSRLEAVLVFVKSLDAKLADNVVTEGEADAALADAEKLAAALVAAN